MMRRAVPAIAAMVMIFGLAPRAEAGLVIGSTTQGSLVRSGGVPIFSGAASLADPGVEFAGDDPLFTTPATRAGGFADLAATTVRVGFRYLGNDATTGVGTSLSYTFTFTGLALDPGQQITGLGVLVNSRNLNTSFPDLGGRFGFATTADSITIRLDGYFVGAGSTGADPDDSITFGILTGPAAVPEPSSLALCGLASLAGLGAWWGRRKVVA